MTERDTQVEQACNLTWFIVLLNQGFAHLAEIRGYSDDQFRKLEDALIQPEPVPDELDDLLGRLGAQLEKENAAAIGGGLFFHISCA